MRILNLRGMTVEELNAGLQAGGRFVIYEYCVSLLVVTFKRGSDIWYVGPGESRFWKGLPYTLLSLGLGWWGFPWGPIYTCSTVVTNLAGGRNVTADVLAAFNQAIQDAVAEAASDPAAAEE